LTYATYLAFYLHLRTSDQYVQRPDALRTHPIFNRLVQLKSSLQQLDLMNWDASLASDASEFSSEDDMSLDGLDGDFDDVAAGDRVYKLSKRATQLDFEDLAALLREADELTANGSSPPPETAKKKSKKAKDTAGESAKKKRKTGANAAPVPVFDLDEPEFVSAKKRASGAVAAVDPTDAYGDAAVLGTADAADKSARRRTLRFHTSKIESASARRKGARAALGGDDDVPYRERRREREERKRKEALARGTAGQGGADLDGEEPRDKGKGKARAEDEGTEEAEDGTDGYYSLIKRQKTEHREQRRAKHDAVVTALRCVS
jgi:U3 small nucleolar RNA-associated protein 3